MEFRDLTIAMQEFVESRQWHQPGSPRPQTPRNIAISLCLEAAEVLEHYQWEETSNDKKELAGELADVTLYLLQLANISGIDLEQAVLRKLKINYTRTWDNEPNSEAE
ncbi:MAG: nucleotide pyrophosphohydrolase [Anaerolineaceae bacterium]